MPQRLPDNPDGKNDALNHFLEGRESPLKGSPVRLVQVLVAWLALQSKEKLEEIQRILRTEQDRIGFGKLVKSFSMPTALAAGLLTACGNPGAVDKGGMDAGPSISSTKSAIEAEDLPEANRFETIDFGVEAAWPTGTSIAGRQIMFFENRDGVADGTLGILNYRIEPNGDLQTIDGLEVLRGQAATLSLHSNNPSRVIITTNRNYTYIGNLSLTPEGILHFTLDPRIEAQFGLNVIGHLNTLLEDGDNFVYNNLNNGLSRAGINQEEEIIAERGFNYDRPIQLPNGKWMAIVQGLESDYNPDDESTHLPQLMLADTLEELIQIVEGRNQDFLRYVDALERANFLINGEGIRQISTFVHNGHTYLMGKAGDEVRIARLVLPGEEQPEDAGVPDAAVADAGVQDAQPVREDAMPPNPDAAVVEEDAEVPDAAILDPDAAPEQDAAPILDAAVVVEDAATPDPDAAIPEQDAAPVEADAAVPEQDAAIEQDAAPVREDAMPSILDAAVPNPDAATPNPDAAPIQPDTGNNMPGNECFELSGNNNSPQLQAQVDRAISLLEQNAQCGIELCALGGDRYEIKVKPANSDAVCHFTIHDSQHLISSSDGETFEFSCEASLRPGQDSRIPCFADPHARQDLVDGERLKVDTQGPSPHFDDDGNMIPVVTGQEFSERSQYYTQIPRLNDQGAPMFDENGEPVMDLILVIEAVEGAGTSKISSIMDVSFLSGHIVELNLNEAKKISENPIPKTPKAPDQPEEQPRAKSSGGDGCNFVATSKEKDPSKVAAFMLLMAAVFRRRSKQK